MKLAIGCPALVLVLALAPRPARADEKADLVLLGGKVVTVDPQRPTHPRRTVGGGSRRRTDGGRSGDVTRGAIAR